MDNLDRKLISTFEGRVVKKELLHRIKKALMCPLLYWSFAVSLLCQ